MFIAPDADKTSCMTAPMCDAAIEHCDHARCLQHRHVCDRAHACISATIPVTTATTLAATTNLIDVTPKHRNSHMITLCDQHAPQHTYFVAASAKLFPKATDGVAAQGSATIPVLAACLFVAQAVLDAAERIEMNHGGCWCGVGAVALSMRCVCFCALHW